MGTFILYGFLVLLTGLGVVEFISFRRLMKNIRSVSGLNKKITIKNRSEFRAAYNHLKPQNLLERKSLLKFYSDESKVVAVLSEIINKFFYPIVTLITVTLLTVLNASINHSESAEQKSELIALFQEFVQNDMMDVFTLLGVIFMFFILLTIFSNLFNTASSDEIRRNESVIEELIEIKNYRRSD
ncbi:hypothetical protein M3664_04605 [Paenibacillus lautus]|uniref:hypothetical protein n=1 Tax=Paenibacillus lautus TaxID=1401 RepID=UPI00203C4186|nr:hypothetical protein [Paenibacillus lautus]MCM3257062.1 hypothetical protein [Paenibacillus lautus]